MRALIVLLLAAASAAAEPSTSPEIEKLDTELRAQEAARDAPGQTKTLRKLHAAQRKLSGEDSIYTWRREIALMSHLRTSGEYTAAVEVLKPMLAKAERLHGRESSEVRDVLTWIVEAYQMSRSFEHVDPAFQRLLAVSKKLHGEKGRLYAYDLQRYGQYLSSRSEVVAAQRVYEQALQIMDATKENAIGLVSSLGLLYMQTDQNRAKQYFDRYIALSQAQQPTEQRISTLWWVASIYRHAGRIDFATPLEKQGSEAARKEIARVEKEKGPNAPELSMLLFSLGGQLMESGDLAAADPVLVRCVALQETLKTGFVAYAQLGTLRRKQGRTKEALALYEKAQATMPGGTGMYSMMADLHLELGDAGRAEKLYIAAQADLDKLFGKRAMLVLRLHLGLYGVHVATKRLDKAESVLAENLDIAERELGFVLASGTETDHIAYFSREAYQLDTAVGFNAQVAPTRASAARLALTTLLRRKGRVLDAAAASLVTLRGRLPAEDKKLLAELDEARAKLAKLAVSGPQATPDYAKQVAALEDQIKRLEVTLAKRSADLKLALQSVALADVQKKVPKDARLVEVVNYQPYARTGKPARRYAAYVLADRGDPTLVDLGEAKPIDDAVAKLRAALADPDNDRTAELGKALHDLTFAKLGRALGTTKHVVIAPDGALNVVPFAALHDGKQYLVKQYAFTYLTSGRDLLRFGVRGKSQGGAIIFADPDFDGPKTAPPPGRRSRAMQGLTWTRLPGTRQEADALAKSLTNATVYRDKLATETTLKAVRSPPILHLATHGFFLPDAEATVENPLLRSGLVFAGANALASGTDDGVVTALEASTLDLRGTRLVVMSACETGVGKIVNGDGVYGLRRALVIAGAESLVMSLWQVDDTATRDLMDGYYRKLKTGAGRSAALRDVQRELHANPTYAHPYYWASFVAAGDSSPL
jgi:CHAT domain-containing protein